MSHHQRTPLLTAVAVTVVALVVAACGGPADVGDTPDGSADLEGDWELVEGRGPDGPLPLLDSHPVTLSFDGQQVGGSSACNSYGGELAGDADDLQIGQLFQTDMACMPDELMAAETAYLEALQDVDQASQSDGQLVLTGSGVELRFDPIPEVDSAASVGTTWVPETAIQGGLTTGTVGDGFRPDARTG